MSSMPLCPYLLEAESTEEATKLELKSGFRIGDESKVTVNKEFVAEFDETVLKHGGDLVGLENDFLEECSVPGTVGSLARRLVRPSILAPSLPLLLKF